MCRMMYAPVDPPVPPPPEVLLLDRPFFFLSPLVLMLESHVVDRLIGLRYAGKYNGGKP